MIKSISEITKKYLVGKSLEQFAKGLGIECPRQLVWYWKEGKQSPSILTLLKVQMSPTAESWAYDWARECLVALLGPVAEGESNEKS
ncbi:MAG: hypothetical protein WHV66_04090 [Anaerolineales bacterium]|jgi:transcriptional regulator with XRE-family HTH domain